VDTAVFASSRASYTITNSAQGLVVSGPGSTDSVTNIERLVFSDGCVALDLSGSAGTAAKVIGAVFGAGCVQNAGAVGICLSLLDAGMSEQDLVHLALNCRLGADAGNDAVVNLLLTNLTGAAPAVTQTESFVSLIEQGAFSQASLGQIAAETALNAALIGLVGLSASGIDYVG
jgi:serralysin